MNNHVCLLITHMQDILPAH